MRRLGWLAFAVFFVCSARTALAPGVAAAANEAGDIVVEVVDAATGAPVSLARVLLSGESVTIGYSDAAGRARFESVAAGTYRASVTKRGFDRQRSPLFDAAGGRSTTVRVRLGKHVNGLQVIGSVSVSSRPLTASGEVGQDSPLRFLDGSLQEALRDVPGLTASGDGFSVEGRDPSQTGFSIDGIPQPSLGGSAASAGINGDLFAGASSNSNGSNGSLGGNVNFLTLQPTRFPQQFATLQYAGNDSSAASFAARGSIRNLGYVVQHAVRGRTSPLDGLTFADASGLTYPHDGDASTSGNLLKLRWSPSLSQTFSVTAIATNAQTSLACAVQTALLPCGYGPGNGTAARAQSLNVADTATVGSTTLFVGLAATGSRAFTDFARRTVAGVASPASSEIAFATRVATASLQFPALDKHEFSLHATAYGTTLRSNQTGSLGRAGGSDASAYREFSLNDVVRPNARLTLTGNVALQGSGNAHAAQSSFAAHWQPNRDDLVDVGVFAGSIGDSLTSAAFSLPDPQSLRYFCDAGIAVGSYAVASASNQRSSGARARYEHAFRHARVGLSAWSQTLRGAPVSGVVTGTSFALPPGYLGAIGGIARSPDVCGASAPDPALDFLTVVAASQISRGVTATGSLQLGTRSILAGYATVQSRFVSAGDAAGTAFGSLTPAGAQVPDAPLHRAGIVASTKLGRSVDALANASYVSASNPNRLPAYTLFNAGIALQLRYGTFALVAQNLTNRFPGPIASTRDAVPLARFGTAPLATVASPLTPRTFGATYTIRVGRSGGAGTGAGSRTATAQDEGDGSFSFRTGDLPSTPPANALTIDPNNEGCTPVAARIVQPVLDEIASLTSAAERARAGGRYPDTLAKGVRTVNNVTLRYRSYAGGAAFVVAIDAGKYFPAVAQCARFSGAEPDVAAKRGLYVPPPRPKNHGMVPLYAPSVGIYLIFDPVDPKDEIAIDPEPATAPADPFALRSACPASSRPLALAIVDALRAASAAAKSGSAQPANDVATIVAHGSGAATWLDVKFGDGLALFESQRCLHVAAVPAAHLTAAGYASVPKGFSLGYSERYGMYLSGGPAAP